jgi:hypothetical protein
MHINGIDVAKTQRLRVGFEQELVKLPYNPKQRLSRPRGIGFDGV